MADDLVEEAQRRHELHREHPSHRPLSDCYELCGLRGEEAFSLAVDLPMDMIRRPNGDGGVDFILSFRTLASQNKEFAVDVKTFQKPLNLIVEVGKVKPLTIYVLAHYFRERDEAKLLGWEWGFNLLKAPVRDFGYGVINHYIPRERLRSMHELLDRVI